ncbi:hypothetical protein BDZ45DRAFT_751084 [Acephala macrosclerotiorum]|nr:hypothetical protein BDZ45DRAFT_751084 [Acephala macrosclerotiorum]
MLRLAAASSEDEVHNAFVQNTVAIRLLNYNWRLRSITLTFQNDPQLGTKYSRAPEISLKFTDLNNSITKAMSLYEQLSLDDDQLRLIELEYESPAGMESEALIHATLSVQDYSSLLEYDALSYTWGTQQELVDINLNGHHFPTGPNL